MALRGHRAYYRGGVLMARYGDIGEQYFKDDGEPNAGGELWFLDSTSGDEIITYYDPDHTTPNTNPVICDAAGRQPDIWIPDSENYTVTVIDPGEPGATPECNPYACDSFAQALYDINSAGFIWDAYSLDDPLATTTSSPEHNGKQALRVDTAHVTVASRGVLGTGNDCAGSTCLRPDAGAGSPIIEHDDTGGSYDEGDGYVHAGMLIDTTGQSTNVATNISLNLGLRRDGTDGGWWGSADVSWTSTTLFLAAQAFSWSSYPLITQPGPMWLDVEFHYYHGTGFQMRIVVSAYVNGIYIGSYDFLESSPGGGAWTWSPSAEMRVRWSEGLSDDTYVSNLYLNTETQATWTSNGNMAALKIAYERNFASYTQPSYCPT